MQSYFQGIWGITWSLAVEEHFYLSLPLVLLLMLRRDSKTPFAYMPYVFATVAILALLAGLPWAGGKMGVITTLLTYIRPTRGLTG